MLRKRGFLRRPRLLTEVRELSTSETGSKWRGRASGPCRWVWNSDDVVGDLTIQEKTALRHLAKGELHDVPIRLIQRLQALGLADGSPEGRLTDAGLELYRTSPRQAGAPEVITGEQIRAARKLLGWRQAELAKAGSENSGAFRRECGE